MPPKVDAFVSASRDKETIYDDYIADDPSLLLNIYNYFNTKNMFTGVQLLIPSVLMETFICVIYPQLCHYTSTCRYTGRGCNKGSGHQLLLIFKLSLFGDWAQDRERQRV